MNNNYSFFSFYLYIIFFLRCISADVPENVAIGSGTYKMCTVQPASSPPKGDSTKGNYE